MLLLAGPALAQEPASIPVQTLPEAAAPAATETRADSTVLQDVVVTAQKKKQSLQKVPVSVGVVSGETLAQSGTFEAGGLENFVANVEIDSDPQAPVIGIRGFFTETDNVGFEPSVGLVFDELALGRPEFVPDGLFDLDRVEVLRGTQGTLFGKNTIAGVINFQTAEPTSTPAASATYSGGDPLQRRLELMFNAPLGESLATRLAAVSWLRNGEVRNSTLARDEGRSQQTAGRLKLLARPGEAWRLSLSTQLSETAVDYAGWQLYDIDADALAYAQGFDPASEDDPLDSHTAFDQPGYVDRDSELSRALLVYEPRQTPWGLEEFSLTGIVGQAGTELRVLIDSDVTAADLIRTHFSLDYQQDSAELRLGLGSKTLFGLGGPVDAVVGLYGLQSRLRSSLDNYAGEDLVNFALSPSGFEVLGLPAPDALDPILAGIPDFSAPINDGVTRGYVQHNDSEALFGQLSWHFTERYAAILGARLGQEKKTADFDTAQVGPGIVVLVVGAEPFTDHRQRKEQDFSPKLGLEAQWTPELMSYLSWTRGFKGGGFNGAADTNENLEFEAERASNWEAGLKSRWFGRSLTLNAALYRTDVKNLQVVDLTGFSYVIDNAAEARLQGLELEARWRPKAARWFEFNASAALSDAKYLSYPEAPQSQTEEAEASQRPECAATEQNPPASCRSQDLGGRTLANAPTLTLSASPMLLFPVPLASGLRLAWALDVSYRGTQYSATDLDPHSRQSGYTLLGSRLVLAPESKRWAIIASGSNLTDERKLDLVFDHSVFNDSFVGVQTPRRSFLLSVQANWK
ncbi:MAG: TonB-dependent receptor [Stagnimonas sp.]|nr:TonB-dependent receptor [Stagnimonas sp.]